MIAKISVAEKSFGNKLLIENSSLTINPNEHTALIGVNGSGKSTLLHIINGQDTDYDGELELARNVRIVEAAQQHTDVLDVTVENYIKDGIPSFRHLEKIVSNPDALTNADRRQLQRYSDAVEEFSRRGFYDIDETISQQLENFELPIDSTRTVGQLSGGQQRLMEFVKISVSAADLALLDEPTNHLDYYGKQLFLDWLRTVNDIATLMVSHDRDLLHCVDRVVELSNKQLSSYKGSYDDYLRTSTNQTVGQLHKYSRTQSQIKTRKNDIIRFKRLKEKARNPDTIRRFKNQQRKAEKDLEELQQVDKPSFWIDSEQADMLPDVVQDSYQQHQAQTISLNMEGGQDKNRVLVKASKLSVGYDEDESLFEPVSFELSEGLSLQLHGRNGAGKTSLISYIRSEVSGRETLLHKSSGRLRIEPRLKIGYYDQQLSNRYGDQTLAEAIHSEYKQRDASLSDTKLNSLLSQYLFDPEIDANLLVKDLSGGQQSRLQLIVMLLDQPDVLILDEPTNHLDLPSIEELEAALSAYKGAILFVSHDTYFSRNLEAEVVELNSIDKN